MITAADLNKLLGKNISQICGNGYASPHDNHCAHFVCHTLDYSFGYNCKTATAGKSSGASLRVHELFARCPAVGLWADKPASLTPCLVFVTAKSHVNIATKTMSNVPKKHVGIFLNGTIWHYSNAQHKVITQQPTEFSHHYPGPGIELFYGQMLP